MSLILNASGVLELVSLGSTLDGQYSPTKNDLATIQYAYNLISRCPVRFDLKQFYKKKKVSQEPSRQVKKGIKPC